MIEYASLIVLAPLCMMLLTALLTAVLTARWSFLANMREAKIWAMFNHASLLALCLSGIAAVLVFFMPNQDWTLFTSNGFYVAPLQATLALLVQCLGWVVGRFSSQYLEGEPRQQRFIISLSMVLACVHLLLIADHWILLIVAWSAIGLFLRNLLCFYEERPFALLASHKKTVADIVADVALIVTAMLAFTEVGSGSISDFLHHIEANGATQLSHACAILLVLAVVMRTALLPVHGWLIQVMEAPTPVSALLHAGVVNLSGYLLIRFAQLFEHSAIANTLLFGIGLLTCVFAALVMFTRVSIKVRLAWSTVAQMGFMVVECAMGLYTFAALHLIGHSIYKAHAFLTASDIVTHTRISNIAGKRTFTSLSMWLAPVLSVGVVLLIQACLHAKLWPVWWSLVLALAWAPALWWERGQQISRRMPGVSAIIGLGITALLTLVSLLFHGIPFGLHDYPHAELAPVLLIAMGFLYGFSVLIQWIPHRLNVLHQWIYAGLYLDEFYTASILRLWPVSWGKSTHACA